MRIKFFITLILLTTLSGFKMQTKKKILFFGDSLTEQAVKPEGFITRLQDTLNKNGLNKNYELIGAGVSGDKVYDLYLRIENDVLAKNPDAVVIFIGVNDVWHKRSSHTGTDADKYERFYNAILKKLKEKNISIFMCTPAVIGEKNDYTNESDGDMNKYSIIVRNLAQKNNCTLIDLREAFLDYLKKNNPNNKDRGILTTDGVHFNAAGNRFIAEYMFRVLSRNFLK